MTVNITPSTLSHTRDGETWWFCSTACRDQFPKEASITCHTPTGNGDHDLNSRR